MKQLLLFDGNALVHRAFHALPALHSPKGELVNAAYGFVLTLLSAFKELGPEYVAVSFDLKAPTFRHKQFKDYKATRPKAPQELYDQIPIIKEIIKTMAIPIFEKEGFEADDVVGTLAKQAKAEKDLETIIVTGDNDTLQLVAEQTKVWTMRRGLKDTVLYDSRKVQEKYGLLPGQLTDFKALSGDASDNIPGVAGIGPKTASELIKKYGTIENLYAKVQISDIGDQISDKIREKLLANRENAFLSKELATIRTDVPIKLDLQKCRLHDYPQEKVVELFLELGFRSLVERLPTSIRQPTTQVNLFDKER